MGRIGYRWVFLLPSFAIAVWVTAYLWQFPAISDGAVYLNHAQDVWHSPFSMDNFTVRPPDFRYFSMALLGLTFQFNAPSLVLLKLLQLLLYCTALVALFALCFELFPTISGVEAGLSVLLFAANPAYIAYLVAVSLDFIALTFHLLYLLFLVRRRWGAAALAAVCMAFSKENAFLVYAATLPVAFWWAAAGSPLPWRRAVRQALPLLAPGVLHALFLIIRQRSPLTASLAVQECGATGLALLLSPNLLRPEIHAYLFNLLVLNFQWLLLVPVMLGAGWFLFDRERPRRILDGEVNAQALTVVVIFFVAWLWASTRCPLYNNVKYIMNAMPLWLLIALVLARVGLPWLWARVPYLLLVLAFFGISSFVSVDPLSRSFYGLLPTEKEPMLCMGSRTRADGDCGNDEIIYNLQRFW